MENIYAVSGMYSPYSVYRYNYLGSPGLVAPPEIIRTYGVNLTPNYLSQLRLPLVDFTRIQPSQINALATAYNQYGNMMNYLTLPQLFYLQI